MGDARGGEWRWLISLIRPQWRLQLTAVALLCVTSVLWVMEPLVLRWIIDHALPSRNVAPLAWGALVILVSQMARSGTLLGSLLNSALSSQRIVFGLRRQLTWRLLRCSAEYHAKHPVGDLAYHLEQDVDQVAALASELLPTFARLAMITCLTLISLFALSVRLMILTALFVPIFIGVGVVYRRLLLKAASMSRQASGERSSAFIESFTGITQVQVLPAALAMARRYVRRLGKARDTALAERRLQLSYSGSSMLVVALVSSLMLFLGGIGVMHHSLTIGSYVAFYTYLVRLFEPLNTLLEVYSRLQRVRVSVERLMALTRVEPVRAGSELGFGPAIGALESLTAEDLTFGYTGAGLVLSGLGFTILRGERLVLFGPSGSGKSSVIKLLARLYDPHSGTIRLNNTDVASLPVNELRSVLGVVLQEPTLFEGSIRENLLLANPAADEEGIREALCVACFGEVVERLPGGLDYVLGNLGSGLSGGEKQRLAIARVVLQNRPVLILDEATNGLDDHVKARVLANLAEYARNKVVVAISHDDLVRRWGTKVVVLQAHREEPNKQVYEESMLMRALA